MAKSEIKLELFDKLMKQEFLLLHIDAKREGVVVPENLSGQSALTLKISYAFQGETLRDDNQVTSYLKFDGNYFQCVLPWYAIWGMTAADNKQTIWTEDVPKEVLMNNIRAMWKQLASKLTGKSNKTESAQEENAQGRARKNTSNHLKRVK